MNKIDLLSGMFPDYKYEIQALFDSETGKPLPYRSGTDLTFRVRTLKSADGTLDRSRKFYEDNKSVCKALNDMAEQNFVLRKTSGVPRQFYYTANLELKEQ